VEEAVDKDKHRDLECIILKVLGKKASEGSYSEGIMGFNCGSGMLKFNFKAPTLATEESVDWLEVRMNQNEER
jgi:hypothetical protein